MRKQFIPYEQALALKELGFEEKCFGKYYYIREHEVYDPRKREDFMFGDNNRIILRDNPCNYGYDANEITICVAPLWQQAFDWFREKHNILGNVYANASGYLFEWHDAEGGTHRGDSDFDGPNDGGVWDTYQEAREALLIRLISIIKKS